LVESDGSRRELVDVGHVVVVVFEQEHSSFSGFYGL
jgi:hypothetical protein